MGIGSGVSCEKRGGSLEVYMDPTPVATGEEPGSTGIASASVTPVTTVAAGAWAVCILDDSPAKSVIGGSSVRTTG